LILVHNDKWKQLVGGDTKLGKSHADELSKETVSILRATIGGRTARHVQTRDLLRKRSSDHDTIALSPLIEDDAISGVVAQLFPSPFRLSEETTGQNEQGKNGPPADYFEGAPKRKDQLSRETIDTFALEDYPFFQRFAEMLPMALRF